MSIPTALALSLGLWIGSAAPAEGGLLSDPQAQALFQDAQAAFNEGDFATASSKIEEAYLIEPKAALLYPWAQAERSQGNCKVANELYQKFIDTGPEASFAKAAQDNIDRCNKKLDKEPGPVPEPEPNPEADEMMPALDPEPERPSKSTPKDDKPKARKWYTDPAGDVLVAVGVAGVAVGGGLMGAAASQAKKAPDEEQNSDYAAIQSRATGFHRGGIAALSVGGVLLAAGIVRWIVVAKRSKSNDVSFWVDPRGGSRGGGLAWRGRF